MSKNTPLRYEYVGSFLRPEQLKKARAEFEAGTITAEELKRAEDAAITDLVAKQKKAGYHVITDGEFRRATWHLDFMWGFNGVGHSATEEGLPFHDEAAKIDGAGPVRAFFSITLPNIMKTILSLSIFFTMWRLTSFDLVYAMTSGGPGDSTSLLAYRIMQEAFTNLNLGYASAIAVCLFIVMTILSFIQLRAIKKFD